MDNQIKPIPNLLKDSSFYDLQKIDGNSFVVLGSNKLVIYNQITNECQEEFISGASLCMLIDEAKLHVYVGCKEGMLVKFTIN